MLPFPTSCLMTDCVSVSLDLEKKSLEFLNRPSTIRVNVKVKDTTSCSIVLSTRTCVGVDGTNNFTVDLSKDFSAEDVCQLRLSIQTMNCLGGPEFSSKLYSAFRANLSSRHGDLLNAESHFSKVSYQRCRHQCFRSSSGHTLHHQLTVSTTVVEEFGVRTSLSRTRCTRTVGRGSIAERNQNLLR